MEINLMDLLDVLAVVFAIIFGLTTNSRQNKKDVVDRAVAQATTDAKLDRIDRYVVDIKEEVSQIRKDVKDLDERVTIVEIKADNANARIDTILKK